MAIKTLGQVKAERQARERRNKAKKDNLKRRKKAWGF
jgi:DNA replication protein DnaD